MPDEEVGACQSSARLKPLAIHVTKDQDTRRNGVKTRHCNKVAFLLRCNTVAVCLTRRPG